MDLNDRRVGDGQQRRVFPAVRRQLLQDVRAGESPREQPVEFLLEFRVAVGFLVEFRHDWPRSASDSEG